jgi:hypothetical protein
MRNCPRCLNTAVIEDGYCGHCRETTLQPYFNVSDPTAAPRSPESHTPGPWHVAPIGGDTYIGINDGRLIADMRREQCDNPAELAECDANAHLIAAAPDLFAACEAALNGTPFDESYRDKCKAALAKARGEIS